MVRTPALAAEITLQPLRRFSGIDAAILFSDILVIPEAMGQAYAFKHTGGIEMAFRIEDHAQIDRLASPERVVNHLQYVGDALRLVKAELNDTRALLGFGGSPWTLATYMVEGGSSTDFARIKLLFHTDRGAFDALLDRLTAAVTAYFLMQIEAGADAIQIFDSWGGAVAGADYEAASLRWIRRVVAAMPAGFPIILYAKGTAAHLQEQAGTGVSAISLDTSQHAAGARRTLGPSIALQGNLDPLLMRTTPQIVARETTRLLESMRHEHGFIVNLGHGIEPDARIECVQALVDTVGAWA